METVTDDSDAVSQEDAEMLWKKIAQPLTMTMKIFGLYHERTSKPESRSRLQSFVFPLQVIYHILIMGLVWFNFVRSIVSFHGHLDIAFDLIPTTAWSFYVASTCTVLFKVIYKREVIKMIANQSKLCFCLERSSGNACKDIKLAWRKYRSFAVFSGIFSTFLVFLNTAAVGYYIYAPQINDGTFDSVAILPWSSTVASGIITVLGFYASAAWILPVAFFAFICRILAGQLDELESDFRRAFCKRHAIDIESLDLYRRHFLILCRSVEMADEMLSPLIAVTLAVNIPIVIFLLYQIWFSTTGILFIIISAFWTFGGLVSCSIISYYAIQVNEKVTLP